ncbi:helix-turn-helix domain-containing protein [Pedobacter sp. KR3-3]|uniref:Helix-turn-helix domain-containing protein n=1 Tax=Pedobacter albus TaxID=3113905 RepID=A0ABU7IA85_9SPHI|nr:helix-turn-helix domain-containing protein [Pedobacter sp. KR3-3]MEE1946266.1 helix-turn-helix domain-containing protein [Pedobacter sp. KR3-3]
MNLSQQILFFFSALGVFNGFIISLYLLFFKKPKSPSLFFLGLLLLAVCLKIGKSFIFYFYPRLPGIYIEIGIWGSAFVGPSLFYFVSATLAQDTKITGKQLWVYLFWTLVIATASILVPYDKQPDLWNKSIGTVISAQLVVCILLTGWLLRTAFLKILNAREKVSRAEKLLMAVYVGNIIVPAAFKLSIFDFFNGPCISGALFFSLVLYLNIFLFMSQRKTGNLLLGATDQARYANKKIADAQASALTEKLQKILLEEQLYKNPDLKLNDLAKKINVSGHQLSQLLNDNLGQSFAAYINEFRIKEACELIANDRGIKLEAIGYEVGFNSKSTFYTAFKKHRQTTPTLYKEQLSAVVAS